MNFFKPKDFGDDSKLRLMTNQQMSDIANAKLEREGCEVVCFTHSDRNTWLVVNDDISTKAKYKALLINIEPIEKCTHPKEKVGPKYVTRTDMQTKETVVYECECGARVKPKEFEVCE